LAETLKGWEGGVGGGHVGAGSPRPYVSGPWPLYFILFNS
jgi:hypothetical protein